MKNLELNKYGVQEMNASEIRKTEGGCLCCDIVEAVEAVDAYINFMNNLRSMLN